jgi:hypothetical protein
MDSIEVYNIRRSECTERLADSDPRNLLGQVDTVLSLGYT